jgi:hypothetical protein
MSKWHLQVQVSNPLRTVDTSEGPYSEEAPPAGIQGSGQSNQNVEITYTKISKDANTFTLTNVEGGPFMLHAYQDVIRIKSDGIVWWPVG